MARIIRSPRAKRDIVGVLANTTETWGIDQGSIYADLFEEAFVTLAEDPQRGKVRDDVRPGLRSFHIKQPGRPARHILFYRINAAGEVELLRCLHDVMDFARHLR